MSATPPTPAALWAVQARGVVKRFGALRALDGLDVNVPRGAQYAFLGPNGAGKSTTIACLSGIYAPEKGQVTVCGADLLRQPLEVKAQIGVVPEELALFERLTGRQYLVFCGRMYGLDADVAHARTLELFRLVELVEKADVLVADYSKGMRRRLALAAALIHAPRLVFLDEPFEGIDVLAAAVIRELLKELGRSGVTILMTTHILEIAQRFATHAGIIVAGRMVTEGSVPELLSRHRARNLDEVFAGVVGKPAATGVRLSFYGEEAPAPVALPSVEPVRST